MDASLTAPLISTPTIEVPATPHPHHADLPANTEGRPGADSIPPSSAQLIPNSSQESDADLDSLLAPIPSSSKRSKYHSPTPPSSSMTPPPSTQPPKRAASPATESGGSRGITPTLAVALSSPPATAARAGQMLPDPASTRGLHFPTSQQLESTSAAELRQLLVAALQENTRLDASEKAARMSAAHYKLQHNLLELETEETTNRLEVEHEMMRREVEVLQQAELARRDSHHTHYSSSGTDAMSQQNKEDNEATDRYIAELKAYAEAMGKENAKLLRRFERAKKVIADKDEDIKELAIDNKRLLDRIRQNREHIHLLTAQGGIYASPQSHAMSATRTVPSTPNYREKATPRQTPRSARHVQQMRDFNQRQLQNQQQLLQHGTPLQHGQRHDSQDSFAALLMADRVLNDQNSAPTTPRRATEHGQNSGHGHPTSSAIRHHRAAQSLSSLPISQPMHMQPYNQMDYPQPSSQAPLLSPPQLGGKQSLSGPMQYQEPYLPRISPRDRVRRRKSRDSTISASDEEERAKEILRVSPQQPVQLQNADPFAGYAPAQRNMVQARPQTQQALPEISPRYEPVAQPQQQVQVQVDDDETEEEHLEEVESDMDIPASQASLSASAMLRRDPRESFEIAKSPRTQQPYAPPSQPQSQTMEYKAGASNVRAHPPLSAAGSVTEKGRVLQAKIFGSVTKPGMEGGEKRKRLPNGPNGPGGVGEEEARAKRLRGKAMEGLGLGLDL